MTQTDQKNVPNLRFPGFEGSWKETRLGKHTVKVGSGVTPKGGASVYQVSGVPLFRSQNVRDSLLDLSDVAYITEQMHEGMSGSHVEDGDVLLNITGASIGRSCVVPDGTSPANVNQHVCIIRLDYENSSEFIQSILASPKGEKLVFQSQAGGGREGLNFENVRKFKIHLPTLPEQRKIASFLGAVDTKIAQLAEKKRLLEDYKKGCMQQLFSQKIRFKDDDGKDFPDWEEKRLGDIFAEIADGGTPSKSNIDFFGGHIPWVVIEDIQPRIWKTKNTLTTKGLASSSAKLWPTGSVILSTGATIGRVGIADVPLSTKQGICGIVPSDGVNNVWVYFLLQTLAPKFERLAQGNTIKEVRAPTIKKIVAHLPHPDEQRKIAGFLSAFDRKIELVAEELEFAKTFKKSLLQQMFV